LNCKNFFKILRFKTVDSTNEIAKKLAEENAEEGTVIVAEHQTCGKGRYERVWFSPKGGLWFSIILRPKIDPSESFKLSFLAALSVAKALNELYNLKAEIKWPNDILINGRKVCGILSETNIKGEKLNFIILGIGVNTNISLEDFPNELRKTSISLKSLLGKNILIDMLLQKILSNMGFYYFTLRNFPQHLNELKNLMKMLGSWVEIETRNEVIEGKVIDLNEKTGGLIVKLKDGSFKEIFDINNCRIKQYFVKP